MTEQEPVMWAVFHWPSGEVFGEDPASGVDTFLQRKYWRCAYLYDSCEAATAEADSIPIPRNQIRVVKCYPSEIHGDYFPHESSN